MGVLKKYIKQKVAEDAAVASGNRYQAMAEAGALNQEYTPPAARQAPVQRPATWGVQPLGQPAQPGMPTLSYPAASSPLPAVKPPSRPMTADYLQRARAVLSKRQAPYWEQALADEGYPAPQTMTPAGQALERYRQLFGKTLPLSILYGPIVGGYQAMPAGQGQEVAPQQPSDERTAYMAIQGALSGASLGAVPITEQARNTQEQVAQVGGQFAGAALPWEAAFRVVGAPAAVAAGPAGEMLGRAAARLAARLGARESVQQGAGALTSFLTREAARGAAASAAVTAPTLLTEPAKTPGEAARRVGGAALSTAAFSAGLPLVGEAVSRFGARPIARVIGDRLRTFVPTSEAVAGPEMDLASAGYRFVQGKGNVPGLWVRQEPTTGLHYGVRVERRVTPEGNVETTYQTFQETSRGTKGAPGAQEARPVIDVTAEAPREAGQPQAAESARSAQEPAREPAPVAAEPVATETPEPTRAEAPGPSPVAPITGQEEPGSARTNGMLQVKYPPTKQTQSALKAVPEAVWGNFRRSGITRVEIVAPNELPLSTVADVSPSQGVLRINANAGNMAEDIGQTIAHEIGHVAYSRMTPEQQDDIKAAAVLYPEIVKRVAPGYASTGASEEVISELYAEAVLHPKSLPEDLRAALLAEPKGKAPAPSPTAEADATSALRLPAPHKSWEQIVADYHGFVDPKTDLTKLIEKDGDVPLALKDANGGRHVVMASVWNGYLRHDPLVTGNIREVFLPANGPVSPRIDTYTLPHLPDLAEGLRRGIAAAVEAGNTESAPLLNALPRPKADLPEVTLFREEPAGEAKKEAPVLVKAAEEQNKALGGGTFGVVRAFFRTTDNREPIWVISSGGSAFNQPAADWLQVPTRDPYSRLYVLPEKAAPSAGPTEAPPAPEEVSALPAPFAEVARGSEVTAETERGTKVQLHYAVVEASDLVASHDTALRRNPDYPAELQPRDRGRIASEEQVSRIASKLNPVRLGESPMVADGAPVVGPDGVVESGNGRVIALQRVYDQGHDNAGKYRQWLLDNAEKFGLDAKAIEQTQAPVLVRVRDTEVDRVKFTQEANEQAVASMSATEKAKSDAGKLTGPLMALFSPSDTGEIDTPANRDFIRNFLGSVVGEAERGEYVQADGSINQAGVLRIRNAVFAKAYGNIATIEKLAESTDNNVRNVTNAMLIAAPRLAAIKEGIIGGRLHDLDLTGDVAAAVNKLSVLRKNGETVQDYLRQTSLLGDELSDLGKDLLDVFDRNGRSAKRLSSILLAYADAVEAAGDPRYGGDLLGRMAPTKAEVLTAALRKVEFGSEGQATLLEGEAAGGPANRAGAAEVPAGAAPGPRLVIGAGNGSDLRSALDDQGQIRVGLDSITIGPDARVPADLAQAVKDAARGWEVTRNRDGGVTLRRPDGPSQAVVREVEALYERVGVREGEDPAKAQELAAQAISDIDHTLRAGLRTVSEGVAGFGGVPSGVRTLGVGIRAELTHRGRVEFRGKKVTTARQLAVLAQIVRNPQFEVFRIFYVKNGVIVADEAISSRLPANSNAFLGKPKDAIDRMKDRMKRLGADGYWLLHNHPSGRPLPSNDDVELTRGFAKELPGFLGHVVINSKKYGVLDSQHYFMPIMEDLPKKIAAEPDLLLSPSLDHPLLGAAISNPLDVVTIGQQLKAPENYVTLLFRAADSKVRAIQQVPVGVFHYEMAAADYLRGRMREFGSAGVLAYYDGPKDLKAVARKLILNNALVDFVTPSGAGLRGALEGKIRKGAVAGLPEDSIPTIRVTEDQADYKMVGPDFFLNEPPKAEAGGTSAFAGARPAPGKPSGPAPMKPMQRKLLIAWLGKQFDVTLAKGHFNQKALGIYKVKPEVIRTRAWGDLEVLAHEIGHHLDKQLGLRGMGYQDELLTLAEPVSKKSYTIDQRLGEGVAEFLRLYLGDPAQAREKAPGFYSAFEQRLGVEPELAQVLSNAQDQFAAHFQATPDEEIDAATSWNNKKAPIGQRIRSLPEAIERAKNWMVDEFFDSNDAVRRIQEKIAGKGELPVEMDAYLRLSILPKLIPGKVEAKLRQWHEALAPLGQKAEDYFRYADARAVLWRSKQFGYDNSKLAFTKEAAAAKIKQVEEGPDAQLYKATFEKEQRMFHEALLELKDAGVLNDEAIARIEGAHEDYVPLFRDIEAKNRGTAGAGRTTVNLPAGVLRQRGGAEPHLDPVERRIRYFARVIGVAERNRVGVALAKFAEAFEGAGKLMDRIPPPIEMVKVKNEDIMGALEDMGVDTDGLDPLDTISFFRPTWAKGKNDTIITVYRGGKPVYYDLHDPAVFRAMAAVDPITTNILDKIMETGTGIFRLGATITPSFSLANLVRDTWESFVLSGRQIIPGQALFQTLRLAASKDPFIRRVIESGLKQGGWLRPERQSVQMLQEIASGRKVNLTLRGLWHLYQQIREQPEFWTRLGEANLEYRKRLKRGASDEEAFLRALYEGGRITLNFTRSGYTTRVWNRRIAFFKIPFEAGYRTYEAAREHPGVFFLKLLPFIAWGAATALLNRDNKQYEEASDYERDRYLLLPFGKALVRIPKANGVFAVLQNTAERAMRQWMKDDPTAWREWGKDALNELTPRITNPAIELLVSWATGQSLESDFPVLTESDKNLPPEMQYDSKTSLLARGVGKVTGTSPKLVQHTIETVIPGYSQGLFGLENFLRRQTGAGGDSPPSARPEDLPVVGRFISRPGEGKQGRSISVFYDERGQADKTYVAIKKKVTEATGQSWPDTASFSIIHQGGQDRIVPKGRLSADQRQELTNQILQLQKSDPDQYRLLANRASYNKIAEKLSTLRARRKEVEANTKMSPEAKRRAIEQINLSMTNLVRQAYGKDAMNASE